AAHGRFDERENHQDMADLPLVLAVLYEKQQESRYHRKEFSPPLGEVPHSAMISYEVDDRQFDKYYSSITASQLPLRCSDRASNHRNRRSARPGDTRFSRNGHRYCRLAVYRRFRELGPGQSPAWTLRSTPANELVTAVGATDEAQPVADLRADVLGHRRRAACLLPFGPVNHCW